MSHLQIAPTNPRFAIEQAIKLSKKDHALHLKRAQKSQPTQDPATPTKAILDRIGTIIKGERILSEIQAGFHKEKMNISRERITKLFSVSSDGKIVDDNLEIAKQLIHFHQCSRLSTNYLDEYEDIDEKQKTLHHHVIYFQRLKQIFLGVNPVFKDQYDEGNWDFYNDASPILPPEAFINGHRIKTISLDTCNLVEIPPTIALWQNITYLNLRNTFISTLPKEIGTLTNLSYLNISNCKNLKVLPSEITKLTNLMVLIFISINEEKPHDFKECNKKHYCEEDVCVLFFTDLTHPQKKWLMRLSLRGCEIDGMLTSEYKR